MMSSGRICKERNHVDHIGTSKLLVVITRHNEKQLLDEVGNYLRSRLSKICESAFEIFLNEICMLRNKVRTGRS